MEVDELVLFSTVSLVCLLFLKKRRQIRWRNRRWWCRPLFQQRDRTGDFNNLFQDLKNDASLFFRYTRMDIPTFNKLLDMLRPHLTKRNWRALNPEFRLIITLRYLATGDMPLSIALAYRIGESTCLKVIKETCEIISMVLQKKFLPKLKGRDWQNIQHGFWNVWNFPGCNGAIDGKHILIQAPPNSGSLYFNYKKTFSVVLMAACDYSYKFTMVDIGAYGSNNDSGVFLSSDFGKGILDETLGLPKENICLPGTQIMIPSCFVGDDAFALTTRMMKPYPGRNLTYQQKVFNYRLSRARRMIENTFGILVARWRIFHKPIALRPESVDKIVMAAVCLHNFLMRENERKREDTQTYCPPSFVDQENVCEFIPGQWRTEVSGQQGIKDLPPTKKHRATQNAFNMRNQLAQYFLSNEGKVAWQEAYVRRGTHHT